MEEPKRRKRVRRRSNKKKKGNKPPAPVSEWPTDSFNLLIARFMGCSCCGYFLTSYRAAQGHETVAKTVQTSTDNWLNLSWYPDLTTIVRQAYGLHIDGTYTHLSHCCEECQRVLQLVQEGETADHTLRIQIMPHPLAA